MPERVRHGIQVIYYQCYGLCSPNMATALPTSGTSLTDLDCAKMRQLEMRHFSSKGEGRGQKRNGNREGCNEEGGEPRVYRRHPIGLKQQAVEGMNLGENVSALARELGVDRINLYRWRAELIKVPSGEPGVTYDPQQQRIQELEAKIAGLERTLGRKEMELDFFAGALRRIKGTRQQRSISGETASTRKSAEGCKRKAE